MNHFLTDVFGGRSPRALAVAATRTFLQGFASSLVGVPLVLNVSIAAWEAACLGGLAAVVALVHGLLQSPGTESTTTTVTTSTAPTEVTVSTEAAPEDG